MKKIKNIILNNNIDNIEKLILIWKEIDKSKEGLYELSEAIGVPLLILQEEQEIIDEEIPVVKTESDYKRYFALFYELYEKQYDTKFKLNAADGKALKRIIQKVKYPIWEKIVKLILYVSKKYDNESNEITFTWKQIVEDIKFTMIDSKINFLIKEVKMIENKKNGSKEKWDWKKKVKK